MGHKYEVSTCATFDGIIAIGIGPMLLWPTLLSRPAKLVISLAWGNGRVDVPSQSGT
jgi:hypothetical protein